MDKIYILKNLNCSNCAAKIEKKAKLINGVEDANLNFALLNIKIRFTDKKDEKKIFHELKKIVRQIEPRVKVIDEEIEHTHSHESEEDSESRLKKEAIILIFSVVFFLLSIAMPNEISKHSCLVIAYILGGYDVIKISLQNIIRLKMLDENTLMFIATVGAILIGEWNEAVFVMLFYKIGEMASDYAVDDSRKSIKSLLDIRSIIANLVVDDKIVEVDPKLLKVNDIIVIKAGERVPVDGVVVEGEANVDTSSITGEPVPKKIRIGDKIVSGFIVNDASINVKVEKEYKDSEVSKMIRLIEEATDKKAKTQKFITKFARVYTPLVVVSAVAITVIQSIISGHVESEFIYKSLSFLVASCPCALVLSIPLGYFASVGLASKKGILFKGSNVIDELSGVDCVVFDKTGTLTHGNFEITNIEILDKTYKEEEFLKYVLASEMLSNHPIALSIKRYAKNRKISVQKKNITNISEISGCGMSIMYNGRKVLVGNIKLMDKEKIRIPDEYKKEEALCIVHISIDGKYVGYISISDTLKDEALDIVSKLKLSGVKKVVMLTGDNDVVAKKIANKLQIDEYKAELLPAQKLEEVTVLLKKYKVAFIGDGINDGPVLKNANVGFAMGKEGSQLAIESADVVLMNDNLNKIISARCIAGYTKKIIVSNIVVSLGVKLLVLALILTGDVNMFIAVFADVGVTLIAVLNSVRILKYKV